MSSALRPADSSPAGPKSARSPKVFTPKEKTALAMLRSLNRPTQRYSSLLLNSLLLNRSPFAGGTQKADHPHATSIKQKDVFRRLFAKPGTTYFPNNQVLVSSALGSLTAVFGMRTGV